MAEAILGFLAGGSDSKSKMIRAVASIAKEVSPIVRTIQAGQNILTLGDGLSNVAGAARAIGETSSSIKHFIPSIQLMGQSMCDSVKLVAAFSTLATTVGIGSNMVRTYQGAQAAQLVAARLKDIGDQMAAQTALTAQRDFPGYVYDMISERLVQTSGDPECDHWFFLWHPDDDWYPKFFHLLQDRPLGARFCGYTNQIDSVFVFMLAVRRRIRLMEHKARSRRGGSGSSVKPVRLHLLVPAYQPILVAEALRIPEEIGDFVIEGRINSNREFVWLNLPPEQRCYVLNVGQWDPPAAGWVDWAMTKVGLADRPPELREPRTLGTRQEGLMLEDEPEERDSISNRDGIRDREADASSVKVERGSIAGSERALARVDGEGERQPENTPLHHREKRHRRKRK